MLIPGLSAIADKYDALLCDVWGVLHNGRRAYPGVPEALANFRAKGGHVLLLSNAPRPSDALPVMFEQMGIPHDVYDGILTSGDATRLCLASHEYGMRCYHIGPDRDLALFDGTGIERVGEPDADFILVNQKKKDGGLWHNHKEDRSTINGFLEDYALVAQAFVLKSLFQHAPQHLSSK